MNSSSVNNSDVIQIYSQWKASDKWVLVNMSNEGAQFTKPKKYNPLAFWFGLLTCWFYGLGIIIWILGIIDYLLASNGPFFVGIKQMEIELRNRE